MVMAVILITAKPNSRGIYWLAVTAVYAVYIADSASDGWHVPKNFKNGVSIYLPSQTAEAYFKVEKKAQK